MMIATSSLIYFPLCVYSLYLKFCKEKKGEIEQVPEEKKKMLESRPEDALVKLVKLVKLYRL